MRNKKHSKKYEEDSSSDSESSDSDSSSSSSDSNDSSPTPKKTKSEDKKPAKKDKNTKHQLSDEDNYPNSSKKSKLASDNENYGKASKQNIVEKSKWDSPQEKLDKRDKRSEKHRRSDSVDAGTDKAKSSTEKERDSVEHRQNDRQRGYNNRNEERHRYDRAERVSAEKDKRDKRYERDRSEYKDDKNRKDRDNKRDDRDYASKRYHYDRQNSSDQKDYKRDNRDYNSRRYSHDRTSSADQNRNRTEGHQNKHRNRRHRSRSASLEHKDVKWGKEGDNKSSKMEKSKDKDKPNFGLSGKLTEETNTYRGIVIKYSEPPEARKPKRRWRLYPFKGEKALQTLYIHRESAYLIGRERKIVDLPIDHPSCSKQHAVLQYRLVPFTRDDGSTGKRVRPYLIDLESANGTFINNKKIEPKKYVELLEKDVIKFGYSSREYVLLHENSKDEAQDDDVKDEEVYEPAKKEKE